jgi:hypothetical protein
MSWRIVKNSLLVGRYAPTTGTKALHDKIKIAAFDFVWLLGRTYHDQLLMINNCRTQPSSPLHLAKSSVATQWTGSGGMAVYQRR